MRLPCAGVGVTGAEAVSLARVRCPVCGGVFMERAGRVGFHRRDDRLERMRALRAAGETYEAIGLAVGLSKQQTHRLLTGGRR